MTIHRLELLDFRIYREAAVDFGPGLTVILGENGQGKTSLLEAVSWATGLGSFRGAADETLIRTGAESAVIRAEATGRDGRRQLVEAELPRAGRNRVKLNRQPLRRRSDLIGAVPATVFTPEDLDLVKGGPASRRRWLDSAAASLQPSHAVHCNDLERIVKQRNALLRSAGGRLDTDAAFTLDVWDAKLAETGTALRSTREALLEEVEPRLCAAYEAVAAESTRISARYAASWQADLASALAQSRTIDLRRGVSTVGPHRDEISLQIGGAAARTHGSQGEQRSLVLAMRLAVDSLIRQGGGAQPVLLLDDVFSELDYRRAQALREALPEGQTLLTTATWAPPGAAPDRVLEVTSGTVLEKQP
ncbi:MAG: DNA replication/repair protein RecF [Acidimicrobiaceae bacterium]|nr:DNA replication/repair protein RecF [Acidimicrobiia bacterium]MCY4492495.1 DNA replication/repair protein RecF [Acidimicrobiaceae bacterium]